MAKKKKKMQYRNVYQNDYIYIPTADSGIISDFCDCSVYKVQYIPHNITVATSEDSTSVLITAPLFPLFSLVIFCANFTGM